MPLARITIHSTQFPEKIREDLLESLRSRKVNHKFHYDSVKQVHRWLALHQAYSPSRNDPDCTRIYDEAFSAAVSGNKAPCIYLIGLGCGGGQKDARLLSAFREDGKKAFYSPVDVGPAMVLTARREALKAIPSENCFPLVCDLAEATDLQTAFEIPECQNAARVFTFFGMLPNFEQETILPRLVSLLRPGDILLASANLAPGPDYAAGVRKILPLYDNALTRDWLMTFLLDLGVETADGTLEFSIEDGPASLGLKRIVANFIFLRDRTVHVDSQTFVFRSGDAVRLFFSYRHTPELLQRILAKYDLQISSQWITESHEEGVFLIQPA